MDETAAAKRKLFAEIAEFARQGEARDLKAKYAPVTKNEAPSAVPEDGLDAETLSALEGMLTEGN